MRTLLLVQLRLPVRDCTKAEHCMNDPTKCRGTVSYDAGRSPSKEFRKWLSTTAMKTAMWSRQQRVKDVSTCYSALMAICTTGISTLKHSRTSQITETSSLPLALTTRSLRRDSWDYRNIYSFKLWLVLISDLCFSIFANLSIIIIWLTQYSHILIGSIKPKSCTLCFSDFFKHCNSE